MKEKTLTKRLEYGDCAYVYRTGILYLKREKYKGREIELWYWKASEHEYWSDTRTDRIQRVVMHNTSILKIGPIDTVDFYPHNVSTSMTEKHVDARTTLFKFQCGAQVTFDEYQWNGLYANADICTQGEGAFGSPYNNVTFKDYEPELNVEILE